jgi:hypothetical protein
VIYDRIKPTPHATPTISVRTSSAVRTRHGHACAISAPYLMPGSKLISDHSLTADEWTATATFSCARPAQDYASV